MDHDTKKKEVYFIDVVFKLRLTVVIFFFGVICSCAHRDFTQMEGYQKSLEKWSSEIKSYQGLLTSLQTYAALLNPELISKQIALRGEIYGWDEIKVSEEEKKLKEITAQETTVFLAFFYTGRKDSSLTRRTQSWQVFLDLDGRRIEGKVIREKTSKSELKILYPNLHPWYQPYRVIFPIGWSSLEGKTVQFRISGPLGSHVHSFGIIPTDFSVETTQSR